MQATMLFLVLGSLALGLILGWAAGYHGGAKKRLHHYDEALDRLYQEVAETRRELQLTRRHLGSNEVSIL